VTEERPGHYRLVAGPGMATPAVVAGLAGWLAGRNLALADLRTRQSLEEAYLAITGARGEVEPAGEPPARRGRGRRSRAR
jgi:hypothetical protein